MIPLSAIDLSLYTYKCTITSIVDGDSLWGVIDRGFYDRSLRELRLNRIDAYEIKGDEKKLGYIAKDFLEEYVNVDSVVVIQSLGYDGFGRVICEMWLPTDTEWLNLSDLLVEHNHAIYKTYRQNSKRKFDRLVPEELDSAGTEDLF